tara:strand:- start:18226 stop:19509 length:1284 start_codon:yes stop_codon:yes gene_type:complete
MRPLRIKASAYPVSSSNFQGLQEMTDSEIEQYISAIITKDFADNTNGSGTAELNVTTDGSGAGTTIGSITDTKRDDAIGTHPTDGATSNVNVYTAKQVTAAASESITNRMVGYETSGNVGINEFTDAELDTDIIDKVIADMVGLGNYTVGQYHLSTSAPSGGTWTARYTLVDTQVDETEDTKYIWQKTAATSSAVDNYKPCKVEGSNGIKEMSVAEMEQIVPNFRNRIVENFATTQGVGTYKLQSSAPSETGTWTQMGDEFKDTRQEVGSQNYTGAYAGSYSGTYTGGYTGAKVYAGAYSGSYTGSYTGAYTGTSAYAGSYTGNYTGNYTGGYQRFFSGYSGGFFSGTYAGTYTGTYTGYYTGAKNYSGTYSGAYSGSYTGYYTGTSSYAGTYSGTYTGYYSGTYAGDTILTSEEDVSSVKLWLRTA